MKLLILPNRLVRPATSIKISKRPVISLPCQTRHYASGPGKESLKTHELLQEYYRSKPDLFGKAAQGQETREPTQGKLSEDSIFEALWEKEEKVEETSVEEKEELPAKIKADKQLQPEGDRYNRGAEGLNYALDPQPRKRWLWERQQVIKAARRGWVITKEQHLRRTERQCRETSPWLKTSIKKLNPLARQIAGKTVDEALLQLRFSRKRVALEVAKHLEHARDQAIVKWGMSLGKVNGTAGGPVAIKLKDKTKKVVTDRTELYIAQAFVSRGSYVKTVELRAKGRANMLKRPHTSITFLLKEEATRIREHKEKQEKALRKKPFVPLPDRPITQQRQYVLW